VNADGSYGVQGQGTAKFSQGRLVVTGTSGARGGGKFERRPDQRSSRTGSDPAMVSVLPKGPPVPRTLTRNPDGADGLPYIQPGPWKSKLTEKDVIGVWLRIRCRCTKQFFIIKKVGNDCAAWCAAPAITRTRWRALDDFVIEGDTLRFNILHEDWADGELPRSTNTSPRTSVGMRCAA
jgi:hypothetical protein